MAPIASDQECLLRLPLRGTAEEVMTPQQLARIYGIEMSVVAHPQTRRPIALPA